MLRRYTNSATLEVAIESETAREIERVIAENGWERAGGPVPDHGERPWMLDARLLCDNWLVITHKSEK